MVKTVLVVALLVTAATSARAAPRAELWPKWQKNDPANAQKIDHSSWDQFLKKYGVAPRPSGINRVRYAAVVPEDRTALKNYLKNLQSLVISAYNRAEQKAYWINLYNAATVDIILSRFPVESIRDINISPGLTVRGPWAAKLLTVEGEQLSLDDIEHRILRPIWKDNLIHYGLNWGSLGSPNLQPEAYTGDKADALLEKGAREFINHPRGVEINNGRLKVSSLYVWFDDDFGGSAEGLMKHWQSYAAGALADALARYSGALEHDYNWRLNAAEPKPQP
jgi:Protein of unknown function, DUF547